jgi:hypothetical protein
LVVDSIAGTHVVARFVDVLLVEVLAFRLLFSFVFTSSLGLVSVFVLGVGFVFVFAVFVVMVAFNVAAVNIVMAISSA